ncbi:oligopeptide:H+ symporter [Lysobacter sp. GX 14042]|uniref:peptide MFS transporter n=1 Tax=Lysobacter sp. GX 14042 TaxID=2907155 RepID=UPI001F22F185|nr:oligopeptide:H+ symporter [Lysobacter sp. GX 14042]MCE7031811.1 oligopeptide:H+ symporter [Lysobacter sp. GX 14042]
MSTPASAASATDQFLGHPKGLFVCFFTEMWERFSFYGMKALLLLYILKYHLFGDDAGYDLLGAYGGLVYAVPVIGGLLADRYLGMRKAVVLGAVLLVLGHLGMAYEGHAAYLDADGRIVRDTAALQVFYLSLALIIMGVGFLKPNISTIVGRLYPENDPRRDSGFTLFYAGINVGALFASLICAFLGETYGWKYGFGAAGIGMVAGLVMFLWGQKYLHGHAEPNDPARLAERVGGLSREWWIYLGSVAGVAVVWQLIQRTWTVHGAMHIIAVALLAWFVWFLATQCNRVQRQQMVTLVLLIIGVLVFFSLYEQTYGSWLTFTDRLLTKDLFGTLAPGSYTAALPWAVYSLGASPPLMIAALMASDRGHMGAAKALVGLMAAGLAVAIVHDVVLVPQTAGSLTFLGAFFIVVLAPVFSWLWPWLEKRGLNPSKPAKMGIGLIFAGLSFIPLLLAAQQAGATGVMASVWWLVAAYFVLEIGEMCLSPIGLSAVTQLSVPRVVGLMMGAFWLGTAYSEVLAAQFGKLASVEVIEGQAFDMAGAAAGYAHLFGIMLWTGIGAGVLFLLVTPLARRWMHGVR